MTQSGMFQLKMSQQKAVQPASPVHRRTFLLGARRAVVGGAAATLATGTLSSPGVHAAAASPGEAPRTRSGGLHQAVKEMVQRVEDRDQEVLRQMVQPGRGASFGGARLFPPDDPWNTDVSQAPVDALSERLLASIGLERGLHPDFGTVWNGAPNGIPYVVVAGDQAMVPVTFEYADESDPGPYPVPVEAPIEGGSASDGDRHVLIVDRDRWKLYELFAAYPVDGGACWRAGSGAVFDLANGTVRPSGWTSADAAGLPILPGLVRYDEAVEQGAILHALRFTCRRTRRAYVAPARHYASRATDPALPPMGMRVRLRAGFNVAPFPPAVQVMLTAMKTYGMFLADNGSDWYVTGAPDPRWSDEQLATLRGVRGQDFEVVQMGEIVTG